MRKNSYIRDLTESQTLFYVLRCISEGKSEDQIAERFNGDTVLVKTSEYCTILVRCDGIDIAFRPVRSGTNNYRRGPFYILVIRGSQVSGAKTTLARR